ncbi:DNA-primase RepB domain-containing protein [Lysobacter sp. P5_B9]
MEADTSTRTDAVRFLEALAPDGALTFQTFDDAKRGRRDLSRIVHGTYWRNRATLDRLNASGAGCFVMVNRGDGNGRKVDNVQAVRAVFLDLDGAPLEPALSAPLSPAIVCESSPGKHHAYWPVTEMPLGDFRRAQQALAAAYGGDTKVCDLPRVMRLPGYVHGKGEAFTSRLLRCDPVKPWRWPEFAEAMALPHGAPQASSAGEWQQGDRNPALYRFACGLRDQGLDQAEAFRRVTLANAARCHPPLDEAEVGGIVASAWQGVAKGFVKLPFPMLDSEAFRALTHVGKVAILALTRKHNGSNNGRLTLTRAEAEAWGLNRKQRTAALVACEAHGLIQCTARGLSASPGHRASPDLFRLLYVPP